MNYSSSYENKEYVRPRSHSPTPKPYRQKTFNHQQNYSGTNSKYGYKQYNSVFNNNYKKPYYPKNNNRRFYYNNYNQQSRYGHNQPAYESKPGFSTFSRSSNENANNTTGDLFVDSSLEEATHTYETDQTTITEVTQMLINQDEDLKDRLLTAMEKILVDLKQKHDKHVDLVKTNVQPTAQN